MLQSAFHAVVLKSLPSTLRVSGLISLTAAASGSPSPPQLRRPFSYVYTLIGARVPSASDRMRSNAVASRDCSNKWQYKFSNVSAVLSECGCLGKTSGMFDDCPRPSGFTSASGWEVRVLGGKARHATFAGSLIRNVTWRGWYCLAGLDILSRTRYQLYHSFIKLNIKFVKQALVVNGVDNSQLLWSPPGLDVHVTEIGSKFSV